MATSPQKRQKKLEKRKAKQRAEKREVARRESLGMAYRLEQTATAPILHCCATETLWDQGMGHVLVSRQLSSGAVAFGMFLVDMYCLGVKNAFGEITPRARYDQGIYDKLARKYVIVNLAPAAARKLVEGAVAYAEELGFAPHRDYRAAKAIFGNISAADCQDEFEYGKDGKPLFIPGPNDDAARIHQIARTLSARLGGEPPAILLSTANLHALADNLEFPQQEDELDDEEEE